MHKPQYLMAAIAIMFFGFAGSASAASRGCLYVTATPGGQLTDEHSKADTTETWTVSTDVIDDLLVYNSTTPNGKECAGEQIGSGVGGNVFIPTQTITVNVQPSEATCYVAQPQQPLVASRKTTYLKGGWVRERVKIRNRVRFDIYRFANPADADCSHGIPQGKVPLVKTTYSKVRFQTFTVSYRL